MSELGQWLQEQTVLEKEVMIRGKCLLLRGLPNDQRSNIFAEAKAKSGRSAKIDSLFLAECVLDPTTKEPIQGPQVWDKVPSDICGPLVTEIMKLNGLDNEDIGRTTKNSDTTDS